MTALLPVPHDSEAPMSGSSLASPPQLPCPRSPRRRWPWTIVQLAAVAPATYAILLLSRSGFAPPSFDHAVAGLAVAWLLLAIGISGSFHPPSTSQPLPNDTAAERLAWAAVAVGILILALVMRALPLGWIPPPNLPWYEEGQTGGIAYQIVHHGLRTLETPIVNYAAALSFTLFGMSTQSLRLPCLLIGLLSVALFLATARRLFRPPVAAFAAFLFAVSRWHIHENHIADENAPPVLLVVATLYLLATLRTSHHPLRFFLLGSLSGVTLYEHPGCRFVLALVPLYFIAGWLRPRNEHTSPRVGWPSLVTYAWGFAIVSIPLGWAIATGSGEAHIALDLARGHTFSLPGVNGVSTPVALDMATTVFRSIFLDLSPDFASAGGRPALEPTAAALSLAGFLWALLTPGRPLRAVIAFWLPLVMYLGTVGVGATYLHRLPAIIPLLYIAVGFPLDDLWRLLERWHTAAPRWIFGGLLAFAATFEAAGNARTLFVIYPNDQFIQEWWENNSWELPLRAR